MTLRASAVCRSAQSQAACNSHTLLCGSANILVKISHSLFNSTRLRNDNKHSEVNIND